MGNILAELINVQTALQNLVTTFLLLNSDFYMKCAGFKNIPLPLLHSCINSDSMRYICEYVNGEKVQGIQFSDLFYE